MSENSPNRKVGGRKLPYTVGCPRYDDDPYRGQRRRPWMAFRVGAPSLSFQRDVFINFVGTVHASLIKAGILLDSEFDVLNFTCTESDYHLLQKEIEEGLAKRSQKYEEGPMSTPVVILVVDSADPDELAIAIDRFADSCYFFRMDRDEILEMVDDMEYDALDKLCEEFGEFLKDKENLVESIAERIAPEEKINTFGEERANDGDEHMISDAKTLKEQLMELERNQQKNRKMRQQHRPQNHHQHHHHQPSEPSEIHYEQDPLDYQKELHDEEVPPLRDMDGPPPGLSKNGRHHQEHLEQRYQEQRRQQMEQRYQQEMSRAPPGLEHGPPPGIELRGPPGLGNAQNQPLNHYDYSNRPPSDISMYSFEDDDDDYHPSTSSSRRPPPEIEVNGPNILSYEEMMKAMQYLPRDDKPNRGMPSREKHYSLMSKDLYHMKLLARFEHPFIALAHNLNLLQLINYAVATRDKRVQSCSKKLLISLFGHRYEQKLRERWLDGPFVDGKWTAASTTLIFELMMLFFSTARFQHGFMLTIENFNDSWNTLATAIERTSTECLGRAGVSEQELSALENLAKHIDKWISAAKKAPPRARSQSPTDETDGHPSSSFRRPSEDVDDSEYQRRRDENFKRAQREREIKEREEAQERRHQEIMRQKAEEINRHDEEKFRSRTPERLRFGRQEEPEEDHLRRLGLFPNEDRYHQEPPRTPKFSFGRQNPQEDQDFRRPQSPIRQHHENDYQNFREPSPIRQTSSRRPPEPPISDEEFLRRQRIRLQQLREQEQRQNESLGFPQVGGADTTEDNDYPTLDLTTSSAPASQLEGSVQFEEDHRDLPTTNSDEKPRQPYKYNVVGKDGEYQPPWMKCERLEPPEDYKTLSAVPTLRDYVNPTEPFLRRIVELGTYQSAQHYLDVQFRLMREDLVSPMRDGINIYRMNGTCKGRRIDGQPCSDITIYNIEKVEGKQVTEREGLEMRIIKPSSFDISRLLENDREMKEMGLVMLSCDRFVDDFHLGHIQQSLLNTQQVLHFAVHEETAPFQPNRSYQMAQATSYLPSYKHVLQNMINLSPFKPIPFERYLVHGRKDIYRPNFQRFEKSEDQKAEELRLERIYGEIRSKAAGRRLMAGKPIPHGVDDDDDEYMMMSNRRVPSQEEMDLEYQQLQEPIFRSHIGVETKDSDKILIDRKWYKISRLLDDYHPTNLDESQRIAFCNTFKHELSLIQGPPGTGKTHIGVQIVKTMLHNRAHWKITAPILVVCYTNSGLDNLLERIHQMIDGDEELSKDNGKPKMIRYGMKCESEFLKRNRVMRYDVFDAYRSQVSDGAHQEQSKTGATKRKKAEKLATSSYTLYCSRNHILSYQILQPVMKPSFQEEIQRFAAEHVDTNDENLNFDEAVACWLLDKDFGRATRLQMKKAKKSKFEGAPEESEDEDRNFLTVENDEDEENGEEDDEQLLDRIFNKMNLECSGKEVLDNVQASAHDEYYTRNHWEIAGDQLPNEVPLMGVKKKNRSDPIDENINKMVQDIREMILNTAPVPFHELDDIKYLFSLARPKRWALYMYWCAEVRRLVALRLPEEIRQYRVACENHIKAQDRFDAEIARMPMIIGCTTTGASRLRPIFERIEPRILIVEEAAEVLEAHILSAMISTIEHCVMIGDHKQLRPNPAVHELGTEYGMQISMFERLVERALPYSQLREQHRMNLLISDTIVKPAFYSNVIDADNVALYPDVSGMATNLFMWSHTAREETPDGISWINTREIEMTVSLVKHLLKQNYRNKDIVVLTTYAAQRNLMTRENPSLFAGPQQYDQGLIPVHTVDSYQGREGKVVIVSLVRSHRGIRENTGVGFLAVANRICVALTRAQHGMYVIGNAAYLSNNARLWDRIVNEQLDRRHLVNYALPLKCSAHGNISTVSSPSDFPKISPEGGCLETCNIEKICGHICRRRCHPNVEEEHERRCEYPCDKTCPNKEYRHSCAKLCFEDCGQCMHLVEVVLDCGHLVTTPCSRVGIVKCDQPCKLRIVCGHPCSARCGEPCVDITRCTQITMCRLDCGHPKPMICGVLNTIGMDENCTERCENRMLTCEHQCAELCGRPCTMECQEIVKVKLPKCGHQQDVKCCDYEPDKLDEIRCKTIVPKKLNPCGHTEPVECGAEPNSDLCTRPCPKSIKECGHICGNLCGTCFVNQVHKCQQRCSAHFDCGHSCSAKCSEPCPPCKAFCGNNCEHLSCGTGEKDFGRECSAICVMCTRGCSNKCPHRSCSMKCFEECDVKACNEPCTEKLKSCGHACLGMCGEKCPNICGTCKRAEYTKIVGASTQKVHRLIQIPKCHHIVTVELLDEHVRKLREQEKQPRCCVPNCNSLLLGINRYAKYNKRFYLDANKKKLQSRSKAKHNSSYLSTIIQLTETAIEELTMVQSTVAMSDFAKGITQLRNQIHQIRNLADQLKRVENDEKWKLAFLADTQRCMLAVARLISITSKQRIQKRKEIPPNLDGLFGKCLLETPFGRVKEELRRVNDLMAENFKTWMIGAVMPKMRLWIARMTLYQMISAMSYQLCCDKRDLSDADVRVISQTIFAVVRCEEQQSYLPKLDVVEAMIFRIAPRLNGAKRDMQTWKDLQIPDF